MKTLIFTILSIFVFSFAAFAQSESCPKILVTEGGIIEAGTPMSFTAQIEGKSANPNLKYDWTVSNGTIVKGLGTASITVDTTGLTGGTNITAQVKVDGLPENCAENTASKTGSTLIVCADPRLLDEFGKLSRSAVKAKIEALFAEMEEYPNAQGYFINYGTDIEIAAREKIIRENIIFRKYDASRITFMRGGVNPNGAGVRTQFWIAPPGAIAPMPD